MTLSALNFAERLVLEHGHVVEKLTERKRLHIVKPLERSPSWIFLLTVLFQSVLVLYLAWYQAPVPDEAAQWAAGVYSWQSGEFDLYSVNPPLVKMMASLPTMPLGLVTDFRKPAEKKLLGERLEWSESVGFLRENADQVRVAMFVARLTIIPWCLLGAWLSWRWAEELYGVRAGCLAVTLWCCSPSILAWSGTILCDIPATASGLAAAYTFRKWLRSPGWDTAVIAGAVLGIAELTKLTWVILFAIWPALWVLAVMFARIPRRWIAESLQLLAILELGVVVINAGYCYSGTGERLGDFTFASRLLASSDSLVDGGRGGNRFHNSLVGRLFVPLPRDYLLGADLQKLDFERGLSSYLCGRWSTHGWWYYYVVCCVVKIPLGSWIVLGFAVADRLFRRRIRFNSTSNPELALWFEEMLLLVPALMLFLLVSSQTGVNRHFRYVLPAFPFVGVFASRAAVVPGLIPRLFVGASLLWNVVGCLSTFPHSMAYFNEMAGGASGGRQVLLDSNLDWGQDLWELGEWCKRHPNVSRLHVALQGSYGEELLCSYLLHALHCPASLIQIVDLDQLPETAVSRQSLAPGWYAISVSRLHAPEGRLGEFRSKQRVETIGETIDIFQIVGDADGERSFEDL